MQDFYPFSARGADRQQEGFLFSVFEFRENFESKLDSTIDLPNDW